MSTLDNTVKPNDYFLYQKGSTITRRVWGRPSYKILKDFLITVYSESNFLKEYKVYLIGGVLQDFNTTWDVDFCVTGDVSDINQLEEYMNYMYDTALNKFGLLIDIQWMDRPIPELSYEEVTSENYVPYRLMFRKIGYTKKQINDNIHIQDLRGIPDVVSLSEYLVEGIHREYPTGNEKIINRILSNPNKVLKSVLDVDTFLNTDEEYFIQNTNRI
jgi:DNA-binding Lrp family transcriptional regulator